MKKIIHLSDAHAGYQVCGARMDQIVTNIIFRKEPASDYVVVVTGDLVNDATEERNYPEVKSYLDRLTSAGFEVLVIPGNHDYGTGTLGSKAYVDLFKQTFFGRQDISYPKLDILADVAFIGLDSMAEELHWYDRLFAEGELGSRQLSDLEKMLNSKKVKGCKKRVVYLHHHPFEPLPLHGLKDSTELGKVLKGKNINALLYGHNHFAHNSNGKWGIPRCYDGGSCTHKLGYPGPHRVIDLTRDPRLDYDGCFD
ncbi:MAG TPA: metallophosphoesterase [Candidatus Hydrogenedentes bacterium]|nr:metallophosphoesterase [Candidatus Hydrogenedentota bacterium]